MLVLTNDTFVFTVPDAVVQECKTLRDAPSDNPPADAPPVPLPNVSSGTMARVVQYHLRAADLRRAGASQSALSEWAVSFFQEMTRPDLYAAMEAANYLGADGMLDEASAYVCGLIRGLAPNQIRDMFMIAPDWTDEESRRAAQELEWALK